MSNEAAERLRKLIVQRTGRDSPLVDAALDAERKATVERIQERLLRKGYVIAREDVVQVCIEEVTGHPATPEQIHTVLQT